MKKRKTEKDSERNTETEIERDRDRERQRKRKECPSIDGDEITAAENRKQLASKKLGCAIDAEDM